jgi:RimJ/RimL family protein N-acetyltransferase
LAAQDSGPRSASRAVEMSTMTPDSSPHLPIETERLLLRTFEPGDFDALATMHSDADLVRWIPWGPRSDDEVRATLERKIGCTSIDDEGDGLGIAVVLSSSGEMIGDFTLQRLSVEHSLAEIGFMLAPGHHGQGYANEASEAILALAFERLGFHRVVGRLEARNDASAAVLERLGMRREAHLVDNEWIKGEWQSELIYAMLEREWAELHER